MEQGYGQNYREVKWEETSHKRRALRSKYGGVLKYKKNGVEVRKVVTEMVDWSASKVVEVQLKWYDHAIPAAAVLEVQRVEFRREAINQNPTLSFPTKPRSAPHEIALHQIALLQITPLLISSLVSNYFTSSDSIMNTFPLL